MLNEQTLRQLLHEIASGRRSVEAAVGAFRNWPIEDCGFAQIDHHRPLRRGVVEAVYCAGKTPQQAAAIVQRMAQRSDQVLATRASPEHAQAICERVPEAEYDEQARTLWIDRRPERPRRSGIALLTAGTSDLPVAAEAARTLDLMGYAPARFDDIGVAGLPRLIACLDDIRQANVVIVVAGMEGALVSVVAGLIDAPVIGVPTSIGYGAALGGWCALLGMLNTCAGGVGVVNIDNGYGAALLAGMMNARIVDHDGSDNEPRTTNHGSRTTDNGQRSPHEAR